MKWTQQSRQDAIRMLKSGIASETVAQITGMSRSSVIALKYQVVCVNNERIQCEICGLELKQITNKHLKNSHDIDLNQYKERFPNSLTSTKSRTDAYHAFKHPNKGKTYEAIYGSCEAENKKRKISLAGIGRKASPLVGRGISGTRKDTGVFARSTYEANIDRIFRYCGKRFLDEMKDPDLNPRISLLDDHGTPITYQPDRVDIDGLFHKGALLEIKGYMSPTDWVKISAFRKQYPHTKLIVISDDRQYGDIRYSDLEEKYRSHIPLWEDAYQNYEKRPDLYQIGYVPTEEQKYLTDNFPSGIFKDISDQHKRFVAQKCISYNRVSLGRLVYIRSVDLVAITNTRKGSTRKSSGEFNYEMWKVVTLDWKTFYVTNTTKTTVFYCYEEGSFAEVSLFFEDNKQPNLRWGRKHIQSHNLISQALWDSSDDNTKFVLQSVNDKLKHRGELESVCGIKLTEHKASKKSSLRNYETWEIYMPKQDTPRYAMSNFDNATLEYHLVPLQQPDRI